MDDHPPSALVSEQPAFPLESPTRRAALAATLNLSALGLGYFYLGLRIRACLHLLGSLLLVAAAWFGHAERQPLYFLLVAAFWLLWMVADGWHMGKQTKIIPWLERRMARGPRLLVCLAALLLSLSAYLLYFLLGEQHAQAAQAAYLAGDYSAALQHDLALTGPFRLTFSPHTAPSQERIPRSSLALYASEKLQAGAHAEAADAAELFLQTYPGDTLQESMRQMAAQAHLRSGDQLCADNSFQAALDHYHTVGAVYPQTPSAAQCAENEAACRLRWAEGLLGQGQYEAALGQYHFLKSEFPQASDPQQIMNAEAAVYRAWADDLLQQDDLESALATYQLILDEYPQSSAFAGAQSAWINLQAQWAQELLEGKDYTAAAQRYSQMQARFGNQVEALDLLENARQSALGKAQSLRSTNNYLDALGLYQKFLSTLPGANQAELDALAAQTLLDWGAWQITNGDFSKALQTFTLLGNAYPASQPAAQLPGLRSSANFEWGKLLRRQKDYLKALEKLRLAQIDQLDQQILQEIQNEISQAIADLSRDTGEQGQQLLADARAGACAKMTLENPYDVIGSLTGEPGRALPCDETSGYTLGDLRARYPGHLRYVVVIKTGKDELERINYVNYNCVGINCLRFATLVRVQKWVHVEVYTIQGHQLLASKKILGSLPRKAETTEYFTTSTQYLYGDPPTQEQVNDWLASIIR